MAALNHFVWDRPLDDPSKIVGMAAFSNRVALTLEGPVDPLFGEWLRRASPLVDRLLSPGAPPE